MQSSDHLGRATFYHIARQHDVRPTAREFRWLQHIERHGPQSSMYLLKLTSDTHRCKDTGLRQLQKLRAGGYLCLPRQQRATERAAFNPYIYELTQQARRHLLDEGMQTASVRPTGHWWHGYTTSCATSSIDITAAKLGIDYIPAHEILAKRNTNLAIPVGGARLIPDQLCALNYGGAYLAFALEVDRGTEPKTTIARRKSYARSIALYRDLLLRNIYKSHYGLTANMLVLWVFKRRSDEVAFLNLLENESPYLRQAVLTKVMGEKLLFGRPEEGLLTEPWNRCGYPPFLLANPQNKGG